MLEIKITCAPEEMEAHLRAAGLMYRPFTGGVEAQPESPLKRLADEMRAGTAKFVSPKRDEEQSGGGTPTRDDGFSHGEPIVLHTSGPGAVIAVKSVEPQPSLADEIDAQGLERPEDLKAPQQPEGAKRVPGQPAPGRKRRTKEELAEDLAYMAPPSEAGHIVTNTARAGDPNDTRAPALVESLVAADPETEAQDVADEAAETAARSTEPTHEHLRAAIGRYTQKHGAKAAIDNTRALVGSKIEDVPLDKIVESIARVDAATAQDKPDAPASSVGMIDVADAPDLGATGTVARERHAAGVAELTEQTKFVSATKAELVQAFLDYGVKFEGTSDPKKMTFSKEDGVKLLGQVFPGAKTIPDIPETPENFGKVVAAVRAAIESNPFKREIRA